jgi:hypothetical protein
MTLDITGRRHRHVHTCEMMMGFFRITGMVKHFLANFFGQVRHLVVGTTTTAGGTTTFRLFGLIKYIQFHHASPAG